MKFEGKEFSNEKIDIDFNHFINCRFSNCTLIFRGHGPMTLDGCSFDNSSWQFDSAASQTLHFLSGLYRGAGEGGKQIVEATFQNIRSGAV